MFIFFYKMFHDLLIIMGIFCFQKRRKQELLAKIYLLKKRKAIKNYKKKCREIIKTNIEKWLLH